MNTSYSQRNENIISEDWDSPPSTPNLGLNKQTAPSPMRSVTVPSVKYSKPMQSRFDSKSTLESDDSSDSSTSIVKNSNKTKTADPKAWTGKLVIESTDNMRREHWFNDEDIGNVSDDDNDADDSVDYLKTPVNINDAKFKQSSSNIAASKESVEVFSFSGSDSHEEVSKELPKEVTPNHREEGKNVKSLELSDSIDTYKKQRYS